ncbi:DUF3800 domain-containing protein [Amycolatopsis sp. NPDC059657]|uniref:DUF3800 domain-containing protein n=1 Tax=Amycolatopsis sp. NPDC059657 TaxID=3346899 RepID=UPI00366D8FE5
MFSRSPDAARFFYVDDSGAESTGFVVYSWIECSFGSWDQVRRHWLEFRRSLYMQYHVPASSELHATQFISGRGNPLQNPGLHLSRADRRAVTEEALATIGSCPLLRVGTVYRRTPARRKAYAVERDLVYAKFIDHLNARLRLDGEYAVVVMDGNGTAAGYDDAHLGLEGDFRRVLEAPWFKPAHTSQFVQMADIAAWTAYQGLLRYPGKEFAWPWYEKYLLRCDANGGPIAL